MLEHIQNFKNLGFDIEEFYDNTFRVSAVPELFRDRNIEKLILELLHELLEKGAVSDTDVVSKKMIAYLACRGAVMAGDKMTQSQMKDLVHNLEKTPNNFACPHGRPTKIEITLQDLNKVFKRS